MGNMCCNKENNIDNSDKISYNNKNIIKKYNNPVSEKNSDVKIISRKSSNNIDLIFNTSNKTLFNKKIKSKLEHLTFQSNNFNLYESTVNKNNNFEEDDLLSYSNLNNPDKYTITFSSSSKDKEFKFAKIYLLGEGTFGKVYLVRQLTTKKVYAMKILNKSFIKKHNQKDHTISERKILEMINSPFIVKLEYAFQTPNSLYLITEFAQGGELFFHLNNENNFHIERVKLYAAELALALNSIHENKCIYRDLKPENILLDTNGHIKLTDFGLSKANLNSSENRAYSLCGTPGYFAPDVLGNNGYNFKVDYFSLGILMYQMIDGNPPFSELKKVIPCKKNKDKILECYKNLDNIEFSNRFTNEAKDLCSKLLKLNDYERFENFEEFKKHPFFNKINILDNDKEVMFTEDFDWDKVENKLYTPMFIPNLSSDTDVKYFSRFFTSQNCVSKNSSYDCRKNKNNNSSNVSGNNLIKESTLSNNNSLDCNKQDYTGFTYINNSEIKIN